MCTQDQRITSVDSLSFLGGGYHSGGVQALHQGQLVDLDDGRVLGIIAVRLQRWILF